MSKKSYKEIEQIIRNATKAHEPAFDEASWKKMEALLDKEKYRKRPFIFRFWWLLPLLIGGITAGYLFFHENSGRPEIRTQKNNAPREKNNNGVITELNSNSGSTGKLNANDIIDQFTGNEANKNNLPTDTEKTIQLAVVSVDQVPDDVPGSRFSKNNLSGKLTGKIGINITPSSPVSEAENIETITKTPEPEIQQSGSIDPVTPGEIIVIKISEDKANEKDVAKIIDSTIKNSVADKKQKQKQKHKPYRFYFIVAAGAEASGVKLFSADKITGRAGLAAGYQISKNLSVQTGFFISNKKYVAGKNDYKIKPGSYWTYVDIKSIDAGCRVYEIPLLIRYDFRADKKLDIFAAAGLSSYIMKKEDYHFYYERYGSPQQKETYYTGNKNLFSVLRLSAGVEKKISKQFSLFAAPGVAIPLSGVGEGEVKLYSTELTIGIKFGPNRKK